MVNLQTFQSALTAYQQASYTALESILTVQRLMGDAMQAYERGDEATFNAVLGAMHPALVNSLDDYVQVRHMHDCIPPVDLLPGVTAELLVCMDTVQDDEAESRALFCRLLDRLADSPDFAALPIAHYRSRIV